MTLSAYSPVLPASALPRSPAPRGQGGLWQEVPQAERGGPLPFIRPIPPVPLALCRRGGVGVSCCESRPGGSGRHSPRGGVADLPTTLCLVRLPRQRSSAHHCFRISASVSTAATSVLARRGRDLTRLCSDSRPERPIPASCLVQSRPCRRMTCTPEIGPPSM